MRNDAIERSANDTILTLADYILQRIEQNKKQTELDINKLYLKPNNDSFNKESDKSEAEYEIYYAFIKDGDPQQFQINGRPVESYPINDKSVFQVYQDKVQDEFYGVYKHRSKEAHRVTNSFSAKEALLRNTFGTSQFEKFRNRTFFLLQNGKVFSLHHNQQIRLNLERSFKPETFFQTIEEARLSVVKNELIKDPKKMNLALRKTLDHHHIPTDLLNKTITLNSISKDVEGVKISIDENKRERTFRLPDLSDKWLNRVRDHPKLKVVFDELIMDSHSIGQGFLSFYGLEIKKELHTRQYQFEVVTNQEGSYIGKLNGNGNVKKVSPYFSEMEAEKQLKHLTKHIQVEKQKDHELDHSIEFSEKNIGGTDL